MQAWAEEHGLELGPETNEALSMGTLGGFPCPPAMVRAEQSSAAPHALWDGPAMDYGDAVSGLLAG